MTTKIIIGTALTQDEFVSPEALAYPGIDVYETGPTGRLLGVLVEIGAEGASPGPPSWIVARTAKAAGLALEDGEGNEREIWLYEAGE